MKIEANAIKIVVIIIFLFPWPANASEKRDHAKMLCDTNLILCKHDCGKPDSDVDIDEGYEQCIEDCAASYGACYVDAGKIPRKSPGNFSELPTLAPNNTPDSAVGGDGQVQ